LSVDLHIHTVASDSLWTPRALAEEVLREGLTAFAVTDHDTDAALEETAREAERLGLNFVPGVEFSCRHDGVEIHILGYFLDRSYGPLDELLKRIETDLVEGATESSERMRAGGISLSPFRFAGKQHPYVELANSLVSSGEAGDLREAFRLVINPESGFFVRPVRPGPREVIEAIRGSGGVSSLAHPVRRGVAMRRTSGEISKLQAMGLQAIEAYSPHHSSECARTLLELCRKQGLGVTGGSDNHKGLLRGRPNRFADVPDWVYEELLELRSSLPA